jgi:hypothetical protein
VGELKEVVWHFVSPLNERGRAADGELWCSGAVGEVTAASGDWRSKMNQVGQSWVGEVGRCAREFLATGLT